MRRFKNILVATDVSQADRFVSDAAVTIARHNGASLKIVDIVPDFPWLTRRTLESADHIRELIRDEKQEQLDRIAAGIRKQRIPVRTEVLLGEASVEIVRAVLRDAHDLVLSVAEGRSAGRYGFFGSTGIRLLRQCPCAVWLVAPGKEVRFSHVLGCVDTLTGSDVDAELNQKILELAVSISQHHGGRCSMLQAWEIRGEKLFKNRLRERDFVAYLERTEIEARRALDEFLRSQGNVLPHENTHSFKGEAATVITEFVETNDVDLVVLGTVGRAGLSGLIIGNTAEQVLGRIESSVLAVKPSSFVSPIAFP